MWSRTQNTGSHGKQGNWRLIGHLHLTEVHQQSRDFTYTLKTTPASPLLNEPHAGLIPVAQTTQTLQGGQVWEMLGSLIKRKLRSQHVL